MRRKEKCGPFRVESSERKVDRIFCLLELVDPPGRVKTTAQRVLFIRYAAWLHTGEKPRGSTMSHLTEKSQQHLPQTLNQHSATPT
jgi:hypothetical protein